MLLLAASTPLLARTRAWKNDPHNFRVHILQSHPLQCSRTHMCHISLAYRPICSASAKVKSDDYVYGHIVGALAVPNSDATRRAHARAHIFAYVRQCPPRGCALAIVARRKNEKH